jgi:hypothetical protein
MRNAIAQSITHDGLKARALAAIAGVVTATDPARAQLIADAERIAQSSRRSTGPKICPPART